jgi:hypothetical protein
MSVIFQSKKHCLHDIKDILKWAQFRRYSELIMANRRIIEQWLVKPGELPLWRKLLQF